MSTVYIQRVRNTGTRILVEKMLIDYSNIKYPVPEGGSGLEDV